MEFHAASHDCQVRAVDDFDLSRSQLIFLECAVDFEEHHARACELLHDEPQTAEETAADFLMNVYRHVYGFLTRQKRIFLCDDRLSRLQLDRDDTSREGR